MSLNFVSTSVLSSSDGVYTETQLQPTSSDSLATHRKPLYEQLRENAEKDQEKYDEVTKAKVLTSRDNHTGNSVSDDSRISM